MQPDGELSGAEPVSWPSTQGCASSSRRPDAQRETLRQPPHRVLVGKPDRAAPQPVSVVDPYRVGRGDQARRWCRPRAAAARGCPTPVSSVCSIRRLLSTSVSPSTPPDSARIAAATTLGRSGADSAASRSRTRSISDALMPPSADRMLRQHRQHPPRRGGKRRAAPHPQPAALEASGETGLRPHRRQAAAGRRSRATSTDRNPPGDGPRTTRPTLGLIAPTAGATAAAAAQPRTSAVVTSTTRSAASSGEFDRAVESPGQIADHGCAAASCPRRSPRPAAAARCRCRARTPDSTLSPSTSRQRLPQRGEVEPAVLQRQVRPAQTRARPRCRAPDRCHRSTGRRR